MHLLLWAPGGAGNHYYGPGTFAFRMYRRRDPEKLRISLVHGNDEQADFPELFDRQKFLSRLPPTRRSSIFSTLSRFEYYRRRLVYVRRAAAWLNEHIRSFDVFQGMGNFSDSLLPALHASKMGVPALTTVMNMRGELEDQSRFRHWLKVSNRRLALISRLNAVVAFSRDIERLLLERGVPEEKVVYIPSCVDPVRFKPAECGNAKRLLREKLGFGDDPVIAFVGELTERKGPHLLLQALSQLQSSRLGWQLVFAGPPNEEMFARRLLDYANSEGWSERVHFLGHVNNVEEIYKAADVFCLPSSDEGMPGSLLEAMASKLPCVVTPFSSAQELIHDGVSGRIVSRSASDLASALRAYLVDESLRTAHGLVSYQTVLTGYTTDVVLRNYMDLFHRLLAGEIPRPD